jgi:hypothetical protein
MTSPSRTATKTRKKTYKTPSLTKYGQLKDLTTGGSNGGKEGKGGQINKKA